MAGSLKSRLQRLKSLGLVKAAELGSPSASAEQPVSAESPASEGRPAPGRGQGPRTPGRPGFLAEWTEIAPFVYRRELLYPDPLPPEIDVLPFLGPARGPKPRLAPPREPEGDKQLLSSSRLRLFDLETTGLSGGTGTLAFLAAVGRVEEGRLLVAQLFLADYPGERDFIAALLAELGPSPCLASYNGRSFDLPLLRIRCVMCSLPAPEPSLHLDALFPARRLWRRIHGGASLGLLERAVLGKEREIDVPGSLVPQVYFEYLRAGDHALMPAVLSHNAEDVASLARLLAREIRIFAEPRKRASGERLDLGGLGRLLLGLGREEEAEELLEAAAGEGEAASGLLLARRRRRAGRLSAAREALGLVPACYAKAVEESRLAERLEGDIASALSAAREALALAQGSEEAEEAGRRVARLERRLARRSGGPRAD